MAELSPAAQAVRQAAINAEPGKAIPAALCIAVHQVRTDRDLKRRFAATMAEMLVLDKILAIAAELEAHS